VKVKLQKDFDFWRQAHLDENRTNSAKAITDAASSAGLSKPQIAYVLATAEHESDSFKTLEEYADGSNYEKRQDLGNSEKGDGPRFKGRGYVQLTGRRNYTLYRDITGTELVKLPFIMMNWSALAVFVLVHGMTNGIYTGQRLDTFVNERSQNFIDARQVVNDHDRADKIAAQANDWLKQL
jgi:predicted chitinase